MEITREQFLKEKEQIEDHHEKIRDNIYDKLVKGNNGIWTNEAHRQMNEDRAVEQEEIFELRKQYYLGVEVGDGVTVRLWSDSHAYTVIKRTPKTITIQQDKATLDPNFKPEWIPGGFAGHCTNQEEQTWTYEPNPNGEILKIRWSEKHYAWRYLDKALIMGRHEFYDYNF